jgi:hypothetical protein
VISHLGRNRGGGDIYGIALIEATSNFFQPAYPKPWRTFLSETTNEVIWIEEAAGWLAVEYGQTAITILQNILWPVLGRPADVEPVGRGKVLARRSAAEVAGAAIARAA